MNGNGLLSRKFPLVLVLVILTLVPYPSSAQKFRNPNAIVVLFDGLTLDDLYDPTLPHLRELSGSGFVGLMNTAVAGPKNDTSAILPMALGFLAPSDPTDEEAYVTSVEIVEGDKAETVFQRRTGRNPLTESGAGRGQVRQPIVHLGIAPLVRRGLADKLVGANAQYRGGQPRISCFGNADTDKPGRRVSLFGINDLGIAAAGNVSRQILIEDRDAPFGVRDNIPEISRKVSESNLLCIVHLGDGARVEAARSRLSRSAYVADRHKALEGLDAFVSLHNQNLLLLSPRPPANARGEWDRLTPVVYAAPTKDQATTVLTSATTRTPGLVANIDVAPTLLYWLGIEVPPATSGHPLELASCGNSSRRVKRIDRLVIANGHGTVPVFALLGILAAVIIFGGLIALSIGRNSVPFAFGIVFLMNMPLALMLCVLFSPSRVVHLAAYTVILMAALAIVEWAIGRRIGSPPLIVAALTGAAVIVDAFFGQALVKFSLFSAYQLQGIRFYGIGNEYMGVLIGVTLLAVFLTEGGVLWNGLLFVAAALVLGLPALGANAGGLIAAVVSFTAAWAILKGRPANWKLAMMAALAGLALAFGMALLDRAMNGSGSSHFGGAIGAAGQKGAGYLWEIAARKIAMNARVLTSPPVLLALVGIGAIAALTAAKAGHSVRLLAVTQPGWTRGLPAAGWGALAAFLFNDSGIVAAIFLIGAFFVTGLYFLFAGGGGPISADRRRQDRAAPARGPD